jgi:hypothetical protein
MDEKKRSTDWVIAEGRYAELCRLLDSHKLPSGILLIEVVGELVKEGVKVPMAITVAVATFERHVIKFRLQDTVGAEKYVILTGGNIRRDVPPAQRKSDDGRITMKDFNKYRESVYAAMIATLSGKVCQKVLLKANATKTKSASQDVPATPAKNAASENDNVVALAKNG